MVCIVCTVEICVCNNIETATVVCVMLRNGILAAPSW